MAHPSQFQHAIEFPIVRKLQKRELTIRGWCFDASGASLRGLRARIGDRIFVAKRKHVRPFIGRRFPEIEDAATSGFSVEIDLPGGVSDIIIECKDEKKKWHELETLRVETPRFRWPWSKGKIDHDYVDWVAEFDTLGAEDGAGVRKNIEEWEKRPLISVLLSVHEPDERWLRLAIDSVLNQWYPHWQLCVAADVAVAPRLEKALRECDAEGDSRIRLNFREANGEFVLAWESALESATGEYIVLFGQSGQMRPHSLFELASELVRFPAADMIFSDEDQLDRSGQRFGPHFKPDFNYDLLLSQNCILNLACYRTTLVREIGGFRPETQGAEGWDLALRIVEASSPEQIRHIPKILYHRRSFEMGVGGESASALEAGRSAVQSHLERTGQAFDAIETTPYGVLRIRRSLPAPVPRVTVIIPTRNFAHLLRLCVETVLSKTDYPDFDLLIVDNDSDEQETLTYLKNIAENPKITVMRIAGPFNYSVLNNEAVAAAAGSIVCLLNNDIEILDGGWLREMVSHAVRPEVGAVGAKLYYPDGRIQHAGVIVGALGGAGHFCKLLSPEDLTARLHTNAVRNYCAVTAACLVIEKSKYLEVDGLDEGAFAVALNDIDFCLKLYAAGYRNVWTPFAELLHHESASRAAAERTQAGALRATKETLLLGEKWPALLSHDPAYNPNLTLDAEDGGLAFPPRLRS